jgi:hypothetical protein
LVHWFLTLNWHSLNLAQLGHDLLGRQSNTFWHNLILSNDKNTQFLSLTLDQFLNAGHHRSRVGASQGLEHLGALLALPLSFECVSGSFLGGAQCVNTALLRGGWLDDFCDSHQVFSSSASPAERPYLIIRIMD